MDEVNEYFLALPEHLRHLVAKDAPRVVSAICVEAHVSDGTLPFLVGAWPMVSNPEKGIYWSQIFMAPLHGESKLFFRFENWSRCASQAEYENYPPHKLKSLASDIQRGESLVRHFTIEGVEEQLELYANHWDFSHGRWKPKDWMNYAVTPFTHHIFSSYREFYEQSDEVVLEQILSKFSDHDHEINLSRRWITMEKEERIAEALYCENGSWSEVEELFRCLLQVIATQTINQCELNWYLVSEVSPYLSEGFCNEDELEAFKKQWIPVIKFWRYKISQHYKPKYFLSNRAKPVCIGTWAEKQTPISINTPTTHELLEAQLHLSQWAHQHCTPAEAATLLPFES